VIEMQLALKQLGILHKTPKQKYKL
jgi:hypothetical protein